MNKVKLDSRVFEEEKPCLRFGDTAKKRAAGRRFARRRFSVISFREDGSDYRKKVIDYELRPFCTMLDRACFKDENERKLLCQ